MEEIKLDLNDHNKGAFYITTDGERLGEMDISITGDKLIVSHTEVSEKAEGKGYAKKLLTTMVDYAKEHHLSVIPLCPYVHAQFKRHPEQYTAVWKQEA